MAGTTFVAASAIGAATPLRNAKAQQQPATLAPSPSWTRALPAGPDRRVKITEEYAKHVARDAFFWAWPLVNIYNKRLATKNSNELAYAGPVPSAPLNRIVMLTDYALAVNVSSPVRTRTSCMAAARWDLRNCRSLLRRLTSATASGFIRPLTCAATVLSISEKCMAPRPDSICLRPEMARGRAEGHRCHLSCLDQHGLHCAAHLHGRHARRPARDPAGPARDHVVPACEYDGRMKSIDWSTIKKLPNVATGEAEIKWSPPKLFVGTLPAVLADAPPLPGEEARYAQVLAVLDAAKRIRRSGRR